MKALRQYLDRIKPNFEKGGKLHAFQSIFDGLETFLFVPNTTSKVGTHIHDSKRIMSMVVIAALPALLFGMYNVGYQNYLLAGKLAEASFFNVFFFGFLAVIPKVLVSYIVGLGIEFAWAQWKHEEIQEGFLVTGILIPLIIPVNCPLWILAIAVAFSVIICKEIFGGTGMNIFNPATNSILGFGNNLPDGFTAATPLGEIGVGVDVPYTITDMITGFIPGSIGETSVIAIAIGAIILLWTGIASWRTMGNVFAGGIITAVIFNSLDMTPISWYEHIVLGGFCFGAVFMATDPVTSARTSFGQYVYGALIGAMAIIIRVMNPGYPEGMMLAILFANMLAPLIDYCVVQTNINKRMKRLTQNNK